MNEKDQSFLSSSKKWDWETPFLDFHNLDSVFGFQLDVAATKENRKCYNFISPEMDAFKTDWMPTPWFLNPPWGKEYTKTTGIKMMDWINRIRTQVEQGRYGVLLCSVRADTEWWQSATSFCDFILFPNGRINFLDANRKESSQPTFPSCHIIYYPDMTFGMESILKHLGRLVRKI